MLKKRIIPVQLLLDDRLVKTVQFDSFRDVGNPVTSSKVYSDQDADELIFLNIDRNARSIDTLLSLLEKVSEVCFMPLTVGGGIGSVEDAAKLIENGADKVSLNSICYENSKIIKEIAERFGRQAVVVSIDVRYDEKSAVYRLYSQCGRKEELISIEEHIANVIANGAGELLINSIEQDGMMNGYDLALLKTVTALSTIPVIICGGAGSFLHLQEAFEMAEVSAVACGSLFNFGDNNPLRAKAFLKNYNIPLKTI